MRRALVASLVAVVGCSDSYEGLLKPPPAAEGRQFGIKVTVPPGEETTVCRNFAMPDGAFDIGRFETAMTPISHHLLVYNLNLASNQVTDEIIDHCDENPDVQTTRVGILFGSQSETSEVELPEGIAFAARGGLAIQLEYHVVNASDQAIDAEAAMNLWRAHGDITGEAGMTFLYHNRIAIPPLSKASARQRCSYQHDMQLMMLVPHMHSRGVAMQAFRDSGSGTPQQLFSVTGWENPTAVFDPPISIAPGDVIDYHCDYDNPTSDYVFDGFSARHDEMCVTGGIYYRPNADRLPLSEEMCFGKGIVYTGEKTCSQINACEQAIDFSSTLDVGEQFDLCLTSGCDAGAKAYLPFDNCRWTMCRPDCYVNPTDTHVDGFKFSDPGCTACIESKCAALRDTCTASACP